METPVLLITFNRPQYLSQVLKALKLANVSNLYVFKDGPRPNNSEDIEKGKEIECLIDAIDWPCKGVKNFMNNNLGCGWGPYSAISWAFQYVDRLIILEDDCVPSTAFFPYCEYLLEKYSEDNRVRHISGFCEFEGNPAFSTFDYIFTQYAHTWGWATWKRVWNNMDMQERLIIPFFRNGGFTDQFATKEENRFFNKYYWARKSPLLEAMHSWDYQYAAYSKMSGALSIVPSKNLIHNIGEYGTHSNGGQLNCHNLRGSECFRITKEPDEIELNEDYEKENFIKYHSQTLRQKIKTEFLVFKSKIFGRPDFK